MYLSRGIVYFSILKLLLIQVVSCSKFSSEDGKINYSLDDYIASGFTGSVYKGTRTEGNKTVDVAFKVEPMDLELHHLKIKSEIKIYNAIGDYEGVPKFYEYIPKTEESGAMLVTELLGSSLYDLLIKSKSRTFSRVTVTRIGLQVLDILEYFHKVKKIVHFDLKAANLAVGYKNDSKIYVFDFNISELNPTIRENLYRNDIGDLVRMLMFFMDSDWSKTFKYEQWKSKRMYKYNISGDKTFINALIEFFKINDDSYSGQPDHDSLRNILQNELENHKDEPNYDKFDWQI